MRLSDSRTDRQTDMAMEPDASPHPLTALGPLTCSCGRSQKANNGRWNCMVGLSGDGQDARPKCNPAAGQSVRQSIHHRPRRHSCRSYIGLWAADGQDTKRRKRRGKRQGRKSTADREPIQVHLGCESYDRAHSRWPRVSLAGVAFQLELPPNFNRLVQTGPVTRLRHSKMDGARS